MEKAILSRDFNEERALRQWAFRVAATLPDNPDDARFVLDYAGKLVEDHLDDPSESRTSEVITGEPVRT